MSICCLLYTSANGQQFYQYESTIKNNSSQPCQSWEADVKFNGSISLSDGWNGRYSVKDDTLHISSMDYNGKDVYKRQASRCTAEIRSFREEALSATKLQI